VPRTFRHTVSIDAFAFLIGCMVEQIDVTTIIDFSQNISGGQTSEQLLGTLLRAALQHTGATRVLFVAADADCKLQVEAQASLERSAEVIESPDGLDMPASVARHVLGTRDIVLIRDPSNNGAFSGDPYFRTHTPRCVFCLPLTNKDKLPGVLYLENDRRADVFTRARVDLMRVLVSLAALALENAMLYRELAERESRIRRLVDANIIGIFLWRTDGAILDANDEFLRMVGYNRQDLAAGSITRDVLSPPEFRARDLRTLAELKTVGVVPPFEKEYIRKNGSRVPILIGFAAFDQDTTHGVAFVVDESARKRAEAATRESEHRYREAQMALAHANRVTTVGQITASIAHEIQQPLTGVVMYAQAALRWLETEPQNLAEVRDALLHIVSNTLRSGEVINRIRTMIRKSGPGSERFQLNDAVLEVIALVRGESGKHAVRVRTDLAISLPLIRADRVQIQQLILNLVLNAIEASAANDGAAREVWVTSEASGTAEVAVAISDSGPGLEPANLQRVFEPFFTTKANGLGLGLSICRSIVEAHDGQISAAHNTPRGAVFRFVLPIRQEAPGL
jgi:PAS domain S-box-containing protein